MGTSIELGNSTSDFADDVLNVTEISAETMEKTHAVTTSRAMKHFHDMISDVLMLLAFATLITILLILFVVIPFLCYSKYSCEGHKKRSLTPRRKMESRSPILHTDDWIERRRNMPEFGLIFDY
ncbi:hypothetical protein L3Y34_011439 [Caenorhabditis briggsae]|uniref:Uncharacterized protein n=1 Tax=Caenorhabditis briggsae TaxID=6238 RepID=A0AAE8ZQ44_CAEBR|nr:hypothetical protein L3Y34_011439 [Caenorhabditis briggsae]